MPNSVDLSGRPFHFIGIGGIGMSALAYILAKRQLPVYGSDIRANHITQRLQDLGAHIFWNQKASNLDEFKNHNRDRQRPDFSTGESGSSLAASLATPEGQPTPKVADCLPQVICSSAIDPTNEEYRAALELGCPIFHRSDLLAALIQEYQSIAIAGTHGKTTTSSMVGFVLLRSGLDPTIVVGGEVKAWDGNARLGRGKHLIAEADESDGSLVKFAPKIGTIVNIELDHPDRYANLDEVVDIFHTFANRCEILVGCWDCPVVRERFDPQIRYSLDPKSGAEYTVDMVAYNAGGTTARVWERGKVLGNLKLGVLGKHNLSNALAAVAIARSLEIEFAAIADALADFEGARRRFELRGRANGIWFIDDYAHHPSEIQATLAAARLRVGTENQSPKRVVAIFQPHRYSRTQTFLSEFASSFGDADVVVVSDVYGAGESKVEAFGGERVARAISERHRQVNYWPTLDRIETGLQEVLQPGDFVIFLGAGNLNQVIPKAVEFHRQVEFSGAL
ncbi:UDP-N-acetylmuramate--L-alanine ligase [Oscillatoriales cyanobacterium LEGE 11467]|uniref:UDP-N-acetylmuramate--L-alanine ligase n=1 Tax=Zarconia navalis LEGE 11467 TaxID=1828826 RepID=A0A928VU58_9CYAN|nr:UDP-N-acetylmuramate--L-alanine ligase [Zarconia navalis]MBE9040206.1 UDP-N-acetylmuramate--L-alanine ligase [Zarconia navalis LEGE 11467]